MAANDWMMNDGLIPRLVAGYGLSGAASDRPGFGWFFGGDAFMNSWAILDYGDFERVRDLRHDLERPRRGQRALSPEERAKVLVDLADGAKLRIRYVGP